MQPATIDDRLSTTAAGRERLVERERELVAIASCLDRAAQGRGALVLVYGTAGVGRTSLVSASIELARARKLDILSARGNMLERGYAFGVARQLLQAPIAGLAAAQRRALFDGAGAGALCALGFAQDASASRAEFAQIDALHWLVGRLAAATPVLIAVDDLQWCDRLTLDFLCYVGHRISELPIVIVAAWRRGEPRARAGRLQALAGERDTVFLTPAPLSQAGVHELLARRWRRRPDRAVVEAIARRTGGLPSLVTELARAIREPSEAPSEDALAKIGAETPESIRRDLVARLASHTDTAKRLAEAIAVLGDEAPLALASSVANVAADPARSAADALVRAGILTHGEALSYTAPLLRDAVYGTISPLDRQALHGRAARSRLAAGAEARAAVHLLHAEPTGTPQFGELLRSAGQRARDRGDLRLAARHLRRAIAEQDGDVWQGSVVTELGRIELELDQPLAAQQHLSLGGSSCWRANARTGLDSLPSWRAGCGRRPTSCGSAATTSSSRHGPPTRRPTDPPPPVPSCRSPSRWRSCTPARAPTSFATSAPAR